MSEFMSSDVTMCSPLPEKARPLRMLGCERLVKKLAAASNLSPDDRQAIGNMRVSARLIPARSDIISEGERPEHVHMILDGWAARYKLLEDGSRQIVAFLLPGDIADLNVTMLHEMDHSIMALTAAKIAYVPPDLMQELPLGRPALQRALWKATLVDEAVLRSWIANIGKREAAQRIANLFCELHARLDLVELVKGDRFSLPLTQEVIANAMGITAIHVNRALGRLRAAGLVVLRHGELHITNLDQLRKLAGFNPRYLHSEQPMKD